MSLQAKMSQGDPRYYNVNRDLAHNFDQLIMEVVSQCEKGTWPSLVKICQDNGVTDEQLGKVCQALCRFMFSSTDLPKESMGSCLTRCGFFDMPEVARIAILARLGIVTLGVHWTGVHEATIGGVGPAMGYKKMRWYGMICSKLMTLPRWRRILYMWQRRIRKAWRQLWLVERYEDQ
jgi:hypothetical protein